MAAISLQPCRWEFFHRDQRPYGNSLAFVNRIIHTAGNPLQFQLAKNISHIVNGLRCICCCQVMMNLKWYPARLTISLQTALSFPPLSVTTKGRPYSRRDISDAIITLSIAFCSKSIQKRVRYLFPAGTLPPSFFYSLARERKKTLIPISISRHSNLRSSIMQ